MKNNFNELKIIEKKFLISILEDGSKTDTQIAKEIGVSKPSVHRIRKKLEKTIISEYIPIVDLDQIGVNVFFVIMFEWIKFENKEMTKKVFDELQNDPHVIFLAGGEGSNGLTNVIFLGFPNVESYNEYFKRFRSKYEDFLSKITTLLVPGKEILKNDFTEVAIQALKASEGGGKQ